MGHTSILHIDEKNEEKIFKFSKKMQTGRILINSPGSQGAIGDVYNFKLNPSLTLGCGSWGRNSIAENIGIKHLLNIKTVAKRRENMLWFQVPEKIYFKYGCLSEAFKDLKGHNRAIVITSPSMVKYGYVNKVLENLKKYGIHFEIFSKIPPDPDIEMVYEITEICKNFNPDLIIALGGGSVIDAAKIMWLLYEHPKKEFEDLAMKFMDIRKRLYKFQKLGLKAKFVAIPTTSGTGSEVTPFAVITDRKKNVKYPIADYELTPDMAIMDPEFVMTMPKNLTAASGIDAVSHSLEAIVAVTATEYTDGLALESLKILFEYLPLAYEEGASNVKAREKVHYAATIAGMSFANAFLGICHAMAHQLGGVFHITHGVANALFLPHVIKYNSEKSYSKFAIFSQYTYPIAREKYASIADFLNLGGKDIDEKIENLIKALEELKKKLNLPKTIIEAGISEKDLKNNLEDLTYKAYDDQCLLTNPRYPLFKEIKEIYLKLLNDN
jgi:acetaldehyde dehydrogenase/alcohol dehydrogenase